MRIAVSTLVVTLAAFAAPGTRVVDAVKGGDRAAVLSLLEQHADVNQPEPDGTTALAWAVRMDDLDLVNRLLRAGGHEQSRPLRLIAGHPRKPRGCRPTMSI